MKNRYKLLITLGVAAVGVVTAYHLVNTPPKDIEGDDQRMAAIVDDGKCIMCHSENAKLPFYASVPVVSAMLKQNIATGLKYTNLSQVSATLRNGGAIDPVTLNKLEYVIQNDLMPLAEFNMMHWGAAINGAKKEMALAWVESHRAKHHSNGLANPEFANEPIQPIEVITGLDSAKVALGRALFHDKRLSADNTVSCATCHELDKGGDDGRKFSKGIEAQIGGVNAPTVYNAVHNKVQFWDGRATDLAAQAAGPPMNPIEMGRQTWGQISAKLVADEQFYAQFKKSYPEGANEKTITDAIAEFEKTLTTPDAPFDRYLKGDKSAVTTRQIEGYHTFKKLACATCHAGQNLGGLSFELMGQQADYFTARGTEVTEEDMGRFKQTKIERDKHRFKVPTLRNLALTPPYFHDGTVETLEEAVSKMTAHQTKHAVTPEQTAAVVAFIGSLTALPESI